MAPKLFALTRSVTQQIIKSIRRQSLWRWRSGRKSMARLGESPLPTPQTSDEENHQKVSNAVITSSSEDMTGWANKQLPKSPSAAEIAALKWGLNTLKSLQLSDDELYDAAQELRDRIIKKQTENPKL